MKPSASLVVLSLTLVLAGCGSPPGQARITGEPLLYAVAPRTGAILDRDTIPEATDDQPIVVPHTGEIVSILVGNIFLRALRDVGSPHVLVYAEIHDDGTDNPETMRTRVLFESRDQPAGVNLGLADRVLYGPVAFKGFPIRIKLYVVELDKEDKEVASRAISSVGGVAATAAPQAGPAIGIVVDVLQAINAMNKDDFELRADVTMHPVGAFGTARIGEASLEDAGEPSQRHGRPYSLATSLRTGSYLIVKRELRSRGVGRGLPGGRAAPGSARVDDRSASLRHDWSQEFFLSSYKSPSGKDVIVEELFRISGGYLYRVVKGVYDERGEPVDRAAVVPRTGPNAGMPVVLAPGIRELMTDQTYVLLTVLTGLPAGVGEEAMRADSRGAVARISGLLDDPGGAGAAAAMGERIEAIASTAGAWLEQRRVAGAIARKVARNPGLRTDPAYVAMWVSQLQDPAAHAEGSVARRNAAAANAGLIPVLESLVVDLPLISDANLQNLRGLRASDVEPIPDRPGAFRLTASGRQRFGLQ